jgi:branched-chain amino acid transport system substrate-binding protein
MKRKSLVLVIILVLACLNFGCSPSDTNTIKTVKIGFVGDMTGPTSMYSQPIAHAHQYAIDYINKVLYPEGIDIGGTKYHFELVTEDDGGKMEESPMASQRALDQGVVALSVTLGAYHEPIFNKLAQMKVPLISHSPFTTEKIEDPWVFRYRNTPSQVMPATAYYVIKELNLKRPAVFSETGTVGTSGGQQWVDALSNAGIPREAIDWQQYKYPYTESQFLPYLTRAIQWGADVIASGGTGSGSGSPQACAAYLQAKELGYKGYFCSYTGLTDVQARKILGPDYSSYLTKVYQGEGVDAYTNPDAKVREWGKAFYKEYGEYPIDMVPWAWDEIMIIVSALHRAGTVSDGEKFRDALSELPFDFLLKSHLKTPIWPQRVDKLFDEKGQAFMEVMVCGWSEEGIKIPKAFIAMDENTMELKSIKYPDKALVDFLTQEWSGRKQ